ncbi:hypothetical protein MLD38_033025 [Melastoma candidum]|uniref:Uncharacterized protein n=1 Tax=Melastoma candidum TaxID=119954 RepID=A0ACB9M620_9MYRT|nr:hypothetical protein MLD38_033025 [Melastoma candidum]
MDKVERLSSENGVLIFTKSSCCMCYTVTILLQGLGVNPIVYETDHNPEGKEIEKYLTKLAGSSNGNGPVPVVFIGGTLIGSSNEIMSHHLNGSLVQLLQPYQTPAALS